MPHEPPAAADVVLHEERLHVATERLATRAVVRRRVVTEVRRIEVEVQREVLEVEHVPLDDAVVDAVAAVAPAVPLELVLSEQVPVVTLEVRPYERVVVDVTTVTEQRDVDTPVRREVADVDERPA